MLNFIRDKIHRFLSGRIIRFLHSFSFSLIVMTAPKRLQQQKDEIEKLRLELAKADRFKSQFVANVSHEIRTPVSGIVLMIDLLNRTHIDKEQQKYVTMMSKSSDLLLTLINNILDISKIESKNMEIIPVKFNLDCVIDEVSKVYYTKAKEKQIDFSVYIAEDIPKYLVGDDNRLKQILINLLENAIKFTQEGFIKLNIALITYQESEIILNFSISDSGVGIATENLGKIFESFTQADGTITRNYCGAGLGLTISSELVKLMGGNIDVDSEIDKGSTFYASMKFTESDDKDSKCSTPVLKTYSANPDSHEATIEENMSTKILIVDDNDIIRRFLCKILENYGYSVFTAENGLEAVSLFETENYDMIFMDVQMPVMDGYTATHEIREKEKVTGGHIPIVALSAHAIDKDFQKSLENGMDYHFVKPFKTKQILELIQAILTKSDFKNEESGFEKSKPLDTQVQWVTDVFEKFSHQADFIKSIFRDFTQNVQDCMAKINLAIENKNGIDVSKKAHEIKSPLSIINAMDAIKLASELEISGNENDFTKGKAIYDLLSIEISNLIDAFEKRL